MTYLHQKAHKIYLHHEYKEILMFTPCSLLVVGWRQHLLLNMLQLKNTVSHSDALRRDDPARSQTPSVMATVLLIVPSFRHHYAVDSLVSPQHRFPACRLLSAGTKRAGADGRAPVFVTEAPHCVASNVRFHRSVVVPVPSQSTTKQWRYRHR